MEKQNKKKQFQNLMHEKIKKWQHIELENIYKSSEKWHTQIM